MISNESHRIHSLLARQLRARPLPMLLMTILHLTFVFSPISCINSDFTPLQDDQFGPFSDSAAAPESNANPFASFSGRGVSEDVDETTFDDFGDFGEFQAAESDIAASGGSWSFTSDTSISSGSDDTEVIDLAHSSQDYRTDSQR